MSTKEFDRIYRENFSKMVTSLVSYFGLSNIAIAEDLVQDTFLTAVTQWEQGLPDNPQAWLFRVCKNKTINYLKKTAGRQSQRSWYEREVVDEQYKINQVFLPDEIQDNQLRLLFAFCHPGFSDKAQVILTLRMIAGLKLEEIARGLGLGLDTVKKILFRTKKKIKEDKVQLNVPFVLKSKPRLQNVHKVLYLIFNEGYAASSGDRLIKHELCFEALHLMKALLNIGKIHTRESEALLALMLFNIARFPAREDKDGHIVDLEQQDRSLWDKTAIRAGFHYLKSARTGRVLSGYHIEAGIASLHCSAMTFADTDWCAIVRLYEHLQALNPSPFVRLNLGIALSYCKGTKVAIELLTEKDLANALAHYYLYHVTLGKLYRSAGVLQKAEQCLLQGLKLTNIYSEKRYIQDLLGDIRR